MEPGAVVRVEERRRRFLAQAFYSSTSQIALRVLTIEERPFDRAFLAERLAAAASFREQVAKGVQACRMVSSEGDQLPSLTIDRYGSVFVLQTLSQGTERLKPQVVEILQEAFSPRSIVERNDVAYRELEGLEEKKGTLAGENIREVEVDENGLLFVIDLVGGQKTGGYLDQRENRLAAREYGHGRALDCFCYAGGFTLNLARCCDSVLGVDSSAEALDLARRNQRLNGLENVEWKEDNCFDFLKAADQQKQRYDTIVLDPPPFARQRSNLEAARRGYKELNLRALKILNPGRFSTHLFVLAPPERGGPAGTRRRGGARRPPHGDGGGAAHPGTRPSHPVDGARDALPEMPDPAGGMNGVEAGVAPGFSPARAALKGGATRQIAHDVPQSLNRS